MTNKKILILLFVVAFLTLLIGCLPGLTPPTPKGVISGRIMVPSSETTKDITGWIPVANATVTLIDSKGVTHTVTTDKDGYYTFTDIAVNANTIITATATIDGNTVITKDIIPQAVAADGDYDAGTADAESTALALIVEELLEQGFYPGAIDLEEIQDSDNFTEVVGQVTSILEEDGNVTTDHGLTFTVGSVAEDIISPPTPPEEPPEEEYIYVPPVTPTVNQAPTINSVPITTATVGVEYVYDVKAIDPDGDILTYSLITKPSGMLINSATGVISWTPTSAQIGNNPVTVEAFDGALSDTQSFTIAASFAISTYNLALSAYPAEGGSVTGAGTYDAGTVVSISATPATGYHFVNWTGAVTGSVNPTTVTMDADKTVIANFEAILEHSTYDFSYTVPDDILAGMDVIVLVTFASTEVEELGYDDVRFAFEATGPGDVTFTATDSLGNVILQINEGFWGPEEGFDLPSEYVAETDWTFNFSIYGDYTITFRLIDAATKITIANIEDSVAVTVVSELIIADIDTMGRPQLEGTIKTDGSSVIFDIRAIGQADDGDEINQSKYYQGSLDNEYFTVTANNKLVKYNMFGGNTTPYWGTGTWSASDPLPEGVTFSQSQEGDDFVYAISMSYTILEISTDDTISVQIKARDFNDDFVQSYNGYVGFDGEYSQYRGLWITDTGIFEVTLP